MRARRPFDRYARNRDGAGRYDVNDKCCVCGANLGAITESSLGTGEWTFDSGGDFLCLPCAAEPENGAERGHEAFAAHRRAKK